MPYPFEGPPGTITFEKDGSWCECTCGNSPDNMGFYTCTQSGRDCEPTEGWGGHYRCDRCGAVGKPD